jgi:hypothetical protein
MEAEMASLFPIYFYGRVSGHKYSARRAGFCSSGPNICEGVFFTAKGGLVHFEDVDLKKLNISVKDVRAWLLDPQNDVFRTGEMPNIWHC